MAPRLSVVPERTETPQLESSAARIRRLQAEAADTARDGINAALDAAQGLARELRDYSGDDLVTIPAGIRDALKKLADEMDSRLLSIRQIGSRA